MHFLLDWVTCKETRQRGEAAKVLLEFAFLTNEDRCRLRAAAPLMNSAVRIPSVFMRDCCTVGKDVSPKPWEKLLDLNVLLAAANQESFEEEAVTNCEALRPWEKPLDVNLLLSPPEEEKCEIEAVASRDGIRQFTQLPGLNRSHSRPHSKHSFDFEAQFKHVTCEIDESTSSSSDFEFDSRLAKLIQTRQRKFAKQILKHAGKDPPVTMPQSRGQKTRRRDTHKLQICKSFVNGFSLGNRSLLDETSEGKN